MRPIFRRARLSLPLDVPSASSATASRFLAAAAPSCVPSAPQRRRWRWVLVPVPKLRKHFFQKTSISPNNFAGRLVSLRFWVPAPALTPRVDTTIRTSGAERPRRAGIADRDPLASPFLPPGVRRPTHPTAHGSRQTHAPRLRRQLATRRPTFRHSGRLPSSATTTGPHRAAHP